MILQDLALYTPPTQNIDTILAIGDSYTSGEGANGASDHITSSGHCDRYQRAWPAQLASDPAWDIFNGGQPSLVFGACSGAKMADLVTRQLKQGNPKTKSQYTSIGKPQIAVMTIGGNDANFFGYVPYAAKFSQPV